MSDHPLRWDFGQEPSQVFYRYPGPIEVTVTGRGIFHGFPILVILERQSLQPFHIWGSVRLDVADIHPTLARMSWVMASGDLTQKYGQPGAVVGRLLGTLKEQWVPVWELNGLPVD